MRWARAAEVFREAMFQSAPGLTVGRCNTGTTTVALMLSFNPRPASRSGDAIGGHAGSGVA